VCDSRPRYVASPPKIRVPGTAYYSLHKRDVSDIHSSIKRRLWPWKQLTIMAFYHSESQEITSGALVPTIKEDRQQHCNSFSNLPFELLRDIFRHVSPTQLFLNIRPTSKQFKTAALSVIREQLFRNSECELELNPSYVMRVRQHRLIRCHSVEPTSDDENVCTWAGDAKEYKNEWSCVDWYRREIDLIPKPLWTWQKVYRQFYDRCKWWEIVSGNPPTGTTGDFLEDICSQMRSQSRSKDGCPPWRVEFSTKLDDEDKARYLALITLPLWAVVQIYSLYDGFGRRSMSLGTGATDERRSCRRVYLSELRETKREEVKWGRFVASLIKH